VHHLHHLSYISDYIRSFGYFAPTVAIILFVIQAAVPIFPYAVLVAASVILFGAKIGFLLSMLGAMLGSILCYWACQNWEPSGLTVQSWAGGAMTPVKLILVLLFGV